MNEERKNELRANIKRLTSNIGKAKKANDFNEVDNLRQQRSAFAKQLADECDEMFIITPEGKTDFLPLEEAFEYYQKPEIQQQVGYNNALTQICQQRVYLKRRYLKLNEMLAEDVKVLMLQEIQKSMDEFKRISEEICKKLNRAPIDWEAIDINSEEEAKFMKGFDINSLLENNDNGNAGK